MIMKEYFLERFRAEIGYYMSQNIDDEFPSKGMEDLAEEDVIFIGERFYESIFGDFDPDQDLTKEQILSAIVEKFPEKHV